MFVSDNSELSVPTPSTSVMAAQLNPSEINPVVAQYLPLPFEV
jgi:hypothetical protein